MTRRRRPEERIRNESKFAWTDEIFEEAKRLYLVVGMSAAQVAKEVHAPTRNCVVGKLNRAGVFKGLPSKVVRVKNEIRRPHMNVANMIKAPPIIHEDTPALGLTILQLRPFHAEITSCRWPIGGTGFEMKFCGRTTRGRPYCKSCRKLSVNPQTAKQKNSSMRGALWAAR
jgi:hypothetical protein